MSTKRTLRRRTHGGMRNEKAPSAGAGGGRHIRTHSNTHNTPVVLQSALVYSLFEKALEPQHLTVQLHLQRNANKANSVGE